MGTAFDVVECGPHESAASVLSELLRADGAPRLIVVDPAVEVADTAKLALIAALDAPMSATASPVPVNVADHRVVEPLERHPMLPPAPTISSFCSGACAISRGAVASIASSVASWTGDWAKVSVDLSQRLTDAGYRHVAAPGAVMSWTPSSTDSHDVGGPGLETHTLWAETRLRPLRLVVDGACLSDDPHNGSQLVVINVARALREVRPDADVALAVPGEYVGHLAGKLGASGVRVIERNADAAGFDVVYRPYQPLDPGELGWLTGAGRRLLTSQLDMIAFANPSYHPSPTLFHSVRNLQRHTMRLADGVTFISEFGRDATFAECPDLDISRCFVVGCGVDVEPVDEPPAERVVALVGERFVACLSATFMHKNRQHAIATFDQLCRRHRYDGNLVIAGPEPFYGRSTAEDQDLLASLEATAASRVVNVGRVDEATKWWLLRNADVVLYPSVVEGFGLVPFEAAAVGTPCLAFDGSAIAEVLAGSPELVPSWRIDEWASAAATLIGSSEGSAAAVGSVRGVAATRTWSATAERTWQAIDCIVARPSTRSVEEGGLASRVAGSPPPVARGARLVHFGNRLRSYLTRRVGAWAGRSDRSARAERA